MIQRLLVLCVLVTTFAVTGDTPAEASPWHLWAGVGYTRSFNEHIPGGGVDGVFDSYEDEMPGGSVALCAGIMRDIRGNLQLGVEAGYLVLGTEKTEALCVPGTYCGLYKRDVGVSLISAGGCVGYRLGGATQVRATVTAGVGLYSFVVKTKARNTEHCCGLEGDFGTREDYTLGVNAGAVIFLGTGDSPVPS